MREARAVHVDHYQPLFHCELILGHCVLLFSVVLLRLFSYAMLYTLHWVINVCVLLQVLGIIALSIGIWALASGSTFSVLTGSQIIGGSALLIITGFAVVFVAAFGMFGAMCKNRVLLLIVSTRLKNIKNVKV